MGKRTGTPVRRKAGEFETIRQIRGANRQAGHHWFDPETMEFFGTSVDNVVYGGRYFVTEDNPPSWQHFAETAEFPYPILPRYTVRRVNDDATIGTVGEFRQYYTRTSAHEAARKAAERTGQ